MVRFFHLCMMSVLLSIPCGIARCEIPARTVHVIVALADNASQGIIPVPAKIGNGDKPDDNLYWGCDEGLKSFFKKSKDWKLIESSKDVSPSILERLIFTHTSGVYLVADAYRGADIRNATVAFLTASAGRGTENISTHKEGKKVQFAAGGGANLLVYIGHDGLMDFKLAQYPEAANKNKRQAIILACASKSYFQDAIKASGATPLLWTTDLMYPGSFILKSALDGWIARESSQKIRDRAAQSYAKSQGCSLNAAKGLLVTGW